MNRTEHGWSCSGRVVEGRRLTWETRVFLNGRELTQAEVQTLQQLEPVNPGRYWVNALDIGRVEGGPSQVDLSVLFKKRKTVG